MALVKLIGDEGDNCCHTSCEPPIYGLCLNLDDKQAKALGITKPPRAGTIVGLKAVAAVRRVSEEIDKAGDSEKEVYLQLQVTHAELVDPPKGMDTAKALYGDD